MCHFIKSYLRATKCHVQYIACEWHNFNLIGDGRLHQYSECLCSRDIFTFLPSHDQGNSSSRWVAFKCKYLDQFYKKGFASHPSKCHTFFCGCKQKIVVLCEILNFFKKTFIPKHFITFLASQGEKTYKKLQVLTTFLPGKECKRLPQDI